MTVGPDAENTDVLDDYGVPQANMDSLAVEGAKLWPHIFKKDQIRTFAGIQPKWVDENGAIQDWKVEIRDDVAPNAVNLVGIESPGLTGSVPLARYVIGLMQEREKFEKTQTLTRTTRASSSLPSARRNSRQSSSRRTPITAR